MHFNKCRILLMGSRSTFWLDKEGKVQGHIALGPEAPPPTLLQMIQVWSRDYHGLMSDDTSKISNLT